MYRFLAFLGLLSLAGALPAEDVYQSPQDFLAGVFAGAPPQPAVLWLRDELRTTSSAILGHPYPGLRIRYWLQDGRSAWILEETGKEQPITVGLVVNAEGIELVRVLAYRENRGWEVRYPFFTDQFRGLRLSGPEHALDKSIDGISGATLSVRALEKLARLALYLHAQTSSRHDPTAAQ
ncbi:MAG: FMN-binding protein [Pseudomonadota bacterium]